MIEDRYGLTLTTTSDEAARHFRRRWIEDSALAAAHVRCWSPPSGRPRIRCGSFPMLGGQLRSTGEIAAGNTMMDTALALADAATDRGAVAMSTGAVAVRSWALRRGCRARSRAAPRRLAPRRVRPDVRALPVQPLRAPCPKRPARHLACSPVTWPSTCPTTGTCWVSSPSPPRSRGTMPRPADWRIGRWR